MTPTLASVFADLPDPRSETANKLHRLGDILTIATCAVIAGAESWEDIAEYGRSKEAFFRQFLPLDHGIPSHDTFYRVFARLDPDAFADRFARWVAAVGQDTGLTRPDIDGPTHIAVDGKSARRSEKATFAGCDVHTSVGDAHGRHEERSVTVVHDPDGLPAGWAGVGSVALVCRDRRVNGRPNVGTAHDYLTSLRVDAAELAGYVRRHWHIEAMHWVLDVAFREDESPTTAGHAAANLGMMRRVAVSLLRRVKTKGSVHNRRLRAGWDDQFLIQVLQGLFTHSA